MKMSKIGVKNQDSNDIDKMKLFEIELEKMNNRIIKLEKSFDSILFKISDLVKIFSNLKVTFDSIENRLIT